MFDPVFGGSVTAPVSAAPDLPSHRTSDYRDPIDDVNDSYERLQESLTADTGTLLGEVRDTTRAPSEVTPVHYPTDPDALDDMLGDAYENAAKCSLFEGTDFGDTCLDAAPSPDFHQRMQTETDMLALESLGTLGEAVAPFLEALNPFTDTASCVGGDKEACAWVAIGLFPVGRFGRLARAVDDLPGGGGGGKVVRPGVSALDDASEAAFKAADNIDDWTVKSRHLAGTSGRFNKFADGVDWRSVTREALESPNASFRPNTSGAAGYSDSFVVITDLGRPVGSRGQTAIKAVVTLDGRIITAYPVKP